MLESLYYVLTWACNRRCSHCYDERFRPYSAAELAAMLDHQERAMRRVVQNLPQRLGVTDGSGAQGLQLLRSRIILSGGEPLLPEVRSRLLFPALELLRQRYPEEQAELVLQTGGDLLDAELLDALLQAGVGTISVSSMDGFHAPLHGENAGQRQRRLTELFESRGLVPSEVAAQGGAGTTSRLQRCYNFFGATPEMWIGKLWPAGRAWGNGLSTAGREDNFCAAWSGARGYLDLGRPGSEVAIDPHGRLYPCCRKTAVPHGDLTAEALEDILTRLAARPAFQALAQGSPQALATHYGLDAEAFADLCKGRTPSGVVQHNPCLGCDELHKRFVILEPELRSLAACLEERTPGRTSGSISGRASAGS